MKQIELPNGLKVYDRDHQTAHSLYKEIFLDRVYCPKELRIDPGGVVFDIGGFTGLASLFFSHEFRASVYAFEPAPENYEILQSNFKYHSIDGGSFPIAISDRIRSAELTYFHGSPSTSRVDVDMRDWPHLLRWRLESYVPPGKVDETMQMILRPEVVDCECWTLSHAIQKTGVSHIDMLKIDAELSELNILNGIEPEDWDKVSNIAAEVHDIGGRLSTMESMLNNKGFNVSVIQEDRFHGTNMYILTARRNNVGR